MRRITLPRESYLPKNNPTLKLVDSQGTDAVVYTYEHNGKLLAIAFHGKSNSPDWHYNFGKEEGRQARIQSFIDGRKRHAEYRAERKAERQKPHTLAVGDIMVSSWGYEQTNVDFYQVIRVIGKNTVEIREIKQTYRETGSMCGYVKPIKDAFVEKAELMIKRVNENAVRMNSFSHAIKWDGSEKYTSSYA
jgi:hypothetical protein